jgi:hypothetical protein
MSLVKGLTSTNALYAPERLFSPSVIGMSGPTHEVHYSPFWPRRGHVEGSTLAQTSKARKSRLIRDSALLWMKGGRRKRNAGKARNVLVGTARFIHAA